MAAGRQVFSGYALATADADARADVGIFVKLLRTPDGGGGC